jgi:hypothetical protein
MHEPELFETYYEINKPHTSPTFWKIVGAAVAVHLVVFGTLSQVNLLQTKACDSPYVGKVCEVLDAAYVGSVFLGTERTSVDSPYEKTELEDADITFVDVSNLEPKFKYPEGFFEPTVSEDDNLIAAVDPNGNPIANPMTISPVGIPGFPNVTTPNNPTMPKQNFPNVGSFGKIKNRAGKNGGFGGNAVLPPANPGSKIDPTKVPDDPISSVNPTTDKNRNKDLKVISTSPTPKSETLSNKSPDKLPDLGGGKKPKVDKTPNTQTSDAVSDVKIFKQALTDLAGNVLAKLSAKEVDLTQPFNVQMNGTLTSEGKFDGTKDPKTNQLKSQFVKWEGDEKTVEVVKQAIEALGNSGWLGYLRNLGVEKVSFTLIQDNENLRAIIVSDQKDENIAKKISSGFNGLMKLAFLKNLGDDEKLLLKSAKVTPEGKSFVLNVIIPKDTAQALIQKKLQENEAKAKATTTPQSNSVANSKNANIATTK